jgi:hypothetical protein
MKLFDYHFCGNRGCIFVYLLHLSRPTTMHTFDIVLVVHPEQHAVPLARINLLVIHTKTDNHLVQVFQHVVLYWDEINNQFHDIIVALI